MPFKEYQTYDAVGLAELVKSKQVKPQEVLEAAIARYEDINADINAVTHTMFEQAYDAAKSLNHTAPLAGVPFLLKDLSLSYAGVPTTHGSRFFKDYTPDFDSELVTRYKQAGLLIMGKTNTPELGTSYVTESELLGPCRNPYDLTKTPGGSSGGSAAAVAAGIVPAAHASDGGGSIRVPASCCGLIGLKPTRARIPIGPERGESCSGLSVQHVLTRSLRDSALLLDVSQGAEVGDPYAAPPAPESYLAAMQDQPKKPLNIGLITQPLGGYAVHNDCLAAVDEAVQRCQSLGATVEELHFPIDNDSMNAASHVLWCANLVASLKAYAQAKGQQFSADTIEPANLQMAQLGQKLMAYEYAQALTTMHHIGRQMGQVMEQYDLLLTPTLAQPPVAVGELCYDASQGSVSDFYKDKGFAFAPFTSLFNVTGQPALSLPLYNNKAGLPIGVQFAAAFGNELLLLQWANMLL